MDDSTDHPVKIALAEEVRSAVAPSIAMAFMMDIPPKVNLNSNCDQHNDAIRETQSRTYIKYSEKELMQ